MTERTIAKLVLALAGLAVFFTGVRMELEPLRYVGMGLVAVAFLLRFIGRDAR
ncbi:MAG: hypothetical protein IT357_05330 [Gemmatimonadaceae bacterium]|nr:hypothetical protein [Gemmatimonadaceae bacterium]